MMNLSPILRVDHRGVQVDQPVRQDVRDAVSILPMPHIRAAERDYDEASCRATWHWVLWSPRCSTSPKPAFSKQGMANLGSAYASRDASANHQAFTNSNRPELG